MYQGNYSGNSPRPRRRRRRQGIPAFGKALLVLALLFAGAWVMLATAKTGGAGETEMPETDPPDTIAPEIFGIQDYLIYQGDEIDLLAGVFAADDRAGEVNLTVETDDLTQPGEHTAIYTAQDSAGNTAIAEAKVTVLAWEEGFVPLETVWAQVDSTLVQILGENVVIDESGDTAYLSGITLRQGIEEIYTWARSNLYYGGHTNRADVYQGGYEMLTTLRGDCYGYFAVAKLMFDRLKIPNIDEVKVKNYEEDSAHIWSLVSIDGGESYYHFDATPRIGDGDDFCLVTDAFLDAYSQAHKNSHNRDTSLYPATPQEPLP